jgi:hypothetical protein
MIIETVAALSLAQAATTQPPAVYVFRDESVSDPALLRGAKADISLFNSTTPSDYPAAALAAQEQGTVWATLRIDASGALADCRIDPDALPALAVHVCELLQARGKFIHALDRNGQAVSDNLRIGVHFSLRPLPPISVPPPAPAPAVSEDLVSDRTTMTLYKKPDLLAFAPAGSDLSGETAVAVIQYPGSPSYISCSHLTSSGNAALDKASCKALLAADYTVTTNTGTNRATLLVRWKNGHAEFKRPSRKIGTPFVFADEDQQRVPGLPAFAGETRGRARLRFLPSRQTPICRIETSTGSDTADVAACRHLESLHYTSPVDIFGRVVEARLSVRIRFAP